MNYPAPNHYPRYFDRPDDDLPNAPYPWQPPASGQARRSERKQLAPLGEMN